MLKSPRATFYATWRYASLGEEQEQCNFKFRYHCTDWLSELALTLNGLMVGATVLGYRISKKLDFVWSVSVAFLEWLTITHTYASMQTDQLY